jgi:hypothetical protein
VSVNPACTGPARAGSVPPASSVKYPSAIAGTSANAPQRGHQDWKPGVVPLQRRRVRLGRDPTSACAVGILLQSPRCGNSHPPNGHPAEPRCGGSGRRRAGRGNTPGESDRAVPDVVTAHPKEAGIAERNLNADSCATSEKPVSREPSTPAARLVADHACGHPMRGTADPYRGGFNGVRLGVREAHR